MGYLVAMEIRVTLFLLVQFCCMLYTIGPINVCTDFEINRYKIDEVENMQISRFIWFIWRHVTQKRYVMRHGDYDTSDRYFDKEHFETNQKSLRLPVQKLWFK